MIVPKTIFDNSNFPNCDFHFDFSILYPSTLRIILRVIDKETGTLKDMTEYIPENIPNVMKYMAKYRCFEEGFDRYKREFDECLYKMKQRVEMCVR